MTFLTLVAAYLDPRRGDYDKRMRRLGAAGVLALIVPAMIGWQWWYMTTTRSDHREDLKAFVESTNQIATKVGEMVEEVKGQGATMRGVFLGRQCPDCACPTPPPCPPPPRPQVCPTPIVNVTPPPAQITVQSTPPVPPAPVPPPEPPKLPPKQPAKTMPRTGVGGGRQ